MPILTGFDIYLVVMLPAIFHALAWVGALMFFTSIGLFLFSSCLPCNVRDNYLAGNGGDACNSCKSKRNWAKRTAQVLMPIGLILWIFYAFVPTRNQLIAMFVIPPVVNNAQVQKIPENLVNLINKEMESLIENIDKKEKNGKKEEKKEDETLKNIAIDAAVKAIKANKGTEK